MTKYHFNGPHHSELYLIFGSCGLLVNPKTEFLERFLNCNFAFSLLSDHVIVKRLELASYEVLKPCLFELWHTL